MNAISYALIAGLVALAILAGAQRVGASLSTTFCTIAAQLADKPTASSCATERN